MAVIKAIDVTIADVNDYYPSTNVEGALAEVGQALALHQGAENPHAVTFAQVGAEPAGAVAAHEAGTDPHAQYVLESVIGQANGVAPLDGSGKVSSAYLPSIAMTDVSVVASEAAQLALVAQEGGVAVRTDLKKSFVHNGGTTGSMADWQELLTPTDSVLSVFGRTGNVVATAGDYTAAQVGAEPTGAVAAHAGLTTTHGVSGALVGTTDNQTLSSKTLTQPTITLKQGTSPTAEGDIQWDAATNKIKVGDGAATKTFSDDAYVLNRVNHTGTQASSTISDFTAAAGAAAPVQSVFGRTGAVVAASGDYTASQVSAEPAGAVAAHVAAADPHTQYAKTIDVAGHLNNTNAHTAANISNVPTGSIAATNVQGALSELDSEKLDKSGGTITGNLTLAALGNTALEIGRTDGVASTPYIDFHSGPVTADYDTRVIASGGTGTSGKGSLQVIAGAIGIGNAAPNSAYNLSISNTYGSNAGIIGVRNYTTIDNSQALTANRTIYGTYNYLLNSLTDANRSTFANSLYGGHFEAVNGGTAGGEASTTNLYGSRSLAQNRAGLGGTATLYGAQNYVLHNNATDSTTAYGTYSWVQSASTATGTITNAYGLYSRVDHDAGTIANGYGLRISMEGTIGTAWGIYSSGETKNYLAGNLGLGTTSPTEKLDVAGKVKATAFIETRVAMTATNIDLGAGNYFSKTITAATTFSVSNVPAAGNAGSFILDLSNGGAYAITWWSGLKWPGGTAPTLSAAGRDVLGFFTHDGGTTWTGLVLGRDVK